MSITVKVARVPSPIQELALNDDATVGDALRTANITVGSGDVINVNGSPATTDESLEDGDRVLVSKGAKGNA